MSADSTSANNDDMAAGATQAGQDKVRHLARHQVMGLTARFLLGMAVNLLGQPSRPPAAPASPAPCSWPHTHSLPWAWSSARFLQCRPPRIGGPWHRQAIRGAAAIAATVTAGILCRLQPGVGSVWQDSTLRLWLWNMQGRYGQGRL